MIVAGALLKANLVRLVILDGTRANHVRLAEKVNKFELPKNPSQEDVRAFVDEVKRHLKEQGVEKVILNRRGTTGKMAGGAGTFILEGVFLSMADFEVELVHSATLAATGRKEAELKTCQPKTADLAKAYDLAFELI